jgi:hypothetical protein
LKEENMSSVAASGNLGANSNTPQGGQKTVDVHYNAPYDPNRTSRDPRNIPAEVANNPQTNANVAAALAAGQQVRIVRWAKVQW